MDPAEFGYSTIEMQHAPYSTIAAETLKDANSGKIALITGAGQGIGAAISESLAKSGADVIILDLKLDLLENTKAACEKHGVKVTPYECDVTDYSRVKSMINEVEMSQGPIDVLVNNAGILHQRPFIMAEFDKFWREIEVNFKAPLTLIHEMLPRMRDRGRGCIINICSRSATVDVPMTLGYVSSKAALLRATHTLQKEMELDGLDPAIHIYGLHPGGVRTNIGGAAAEKDVKDKYGDVADEEYFQSLFKDGPSLCGQTCAWLAAGKGKGLRGLFIDCRQDVSKLLEYGRERLLKENRNRLTVNFIEGYCNEP